jgi:hypothetical protein
MSESVNHSLRRRHIDALQKSLDTPIRVSVREFLPSTGMKKETLPVRAIMIKLPYHLPQLKRHRNHAALIPLSLDGNEEIIEIYILDSQGQRLLNPDSGIEKQQTKVECSRPGCLCHDDGPYVVC